MNKNLTAVLVAASLLVSSMFIEKNTHIIERSQFLYHKTLGKSFKDGAYEKPFLDTRLSTGKGSKDLELEVKVNGKYLPLEVYQNHLRIGKPDYTIKSVPRKTLVDYVTKNYDNLTDNQKLGLLKTSLPYAVELAKKKTSQYYLQLKNLIKSIHRKP